MWVWRISPSSHVISRCLPWLSTVSIVRPAWGTGPIRRGASKRSIGRPTSAVRIALAVRWIVSPSGTRSSLRGSPWRVVARSRHDHVHGSCPTCASAIRTRRSCPLVIWLRTSSLTASTGVNQARSRASWRRFAVPVDGHHVGEAHSVLTGVVEAAAVGIGEVLDHRERRRIDRDAGKRPRPEILLAVSHQGVAHPLAEQNPPADDHPADRPVGERRATGDRRR